MSVHSLILTDRGRCHVHRWAPSCSCGLWRGCFRRRKAEAVAQHREHRNAQARLIRRRLPGPQRLTPFDQLPEALR